MGLCSAANASDLAAVGVHKLVIKANAPDVHLQHGLLS